ncbi:hypothetical protein F4801DRAFT_452541 [Xylaria longipes]|nr:hypothetical protein F4801DRAFT_452541 [Xylaria longipes]RYC59616.1 hypothetical protein CHU98_g6596 [Xylaria longipes]
MKFATQIGAILALVSGPLVHAWNATIYDSSNCTGNSYHIYPEPTELRTKYFEMKSSSGAEIVCTFHGTNNSTSPCKEQFPVGKSVLSSVGPCRTYSRGHASGEYADQKQGECKTTDFNILSVVCYDEDD